MTENEYLLIFKRIFETHYQPLRLYAMRIVGSYEASEDIIQDCFFELWQNRENIDFTSSLKGYLYKSAFNRSVNYVRSKGVSLKVNSDRISEELFDMIMEEEEYLVYKDLSLHITKGINTLPEQCRKVFILSRTYELKNKDIAEKLNISVKAVEKHITHALKLLRVYLKKNEILFLLFYLFSVEGRVFLF